MTDNNHAPLSEVERVATIIQTAIESRFGGNAPIEKAVTLVAARAILADPAYARAGEMREALEDIWGVCTNDGADEPYSAEDARGWIEVRARAALPGDGQ